MDVLVTLWVVVALTAALVLGMAAFVKHPGAIIDCPGTRTSEPAAAHG